MVMSSRREPILPFVAAARRLHRGEAARHEHERVRHRAASKYATEVPPLGVANGRAGSSRPRRRRSLLGRDHPPQRHSAFGTSLIVASTSPPLPRRGRRRPHSTCRNPDSVLCCGAHSAASSAACLRQSHVRARERVCRDRDNENGGSTKFRWAAASATHSSESPATVSRPPSRPLEVAVDHVITNKNCVVINRSSRWWRSCALSSGAACSATPAE